MWLTDFLLVKILGKKYDYRNRDDKGTTTLHCFIYLKCAYHVRVSWLHHVPVNIIDDKGKSRV